MKKYAMPMILFTVFEAVAIALWLAKDNLFYLFNFTYIGASVALGVVPAASPSCSSASICWSSSA